MPIVGRQWTPWAAWFLEIASGKRIMTVAFPSEDHANMWLLLVPELQRVGELPEPVVIHKRHSYISLN